MMFHPAIHELFAYAEGRTGDHSEVPVRVAAHLAKCRSCKAHVQAMHDSLAVVAAVPRLEPAPASTAQILVAARGERRRLEQQAHARRRRHMTLLKAAACAAGLVVVAVFSYGSALSRNSADQAEGPVVVASLAENQSGNGPLETGGPLRTGAIDTAASRLVNLSANSPEALRKAAEEIRTLAAALKVHDAVPRNLWERAQRQAVLSLEADITAAMAALERNPGCARAATVVNVNIQRQAQTLKALYTEQSL